jgi:hypothetical protein
VIEGNPDERTLGIVDYGNRSLDCLLVAQSEIERLPLMTADAVIAAYDIELIWAGRGRTPGRSRR